MTDLVCMICGLALTPDEEAQPYTVHMVSALTGEDSPTYWPVCFRCRPDEEEEAADE